MDMLKVRMERLFGTYGKALILPYDQGLEHGPADFFHAYHARDPRHIIEIAKRGRYDAVALHVGNATRLFGDHFGKVPLILKVNGKTNIPEDDEPLSPITASIDDALRLSALAVGYTLYVGSPRQDEDIEQFAQIREEAHRWGLPVIVWAYPRGRSVEEKGGKNSLFAIEYAARAAAELGADMVKVNVPDPAKQTGEPGPYSKFRPTLGEAVQRVVEAACGAPVIFAGGEMASDDELIEKAEVCMDAGASGLIFGRNIWQRPLDKALEMTSRIREVAKKHRARRAG
jgi:fructose-bisphosphate aldolase, class I